MIGSGDDISPLLISDNNDSLSSSSIINEDIQVNKRTVTTMQLMILVYFWTCGGPFGIEPAVGAGGVAITTATLLGISLLWALPQAVMSAELSLMMNVNGGNIIWVQQAFGDFGGYFNAGCFMTSCLASQAMTVLTFVEYFKLALNLDTGVEWIIRIAFISCAIMVDIWGLKYLSRLSWILLAFIFSPFVALNLTTVFIQPRIHIDFSNLIQIPNYKEINWGVLVSTVVWCLGGYDYVGSIAGEVKGGKSAFIIGILATFPINLLNYMYPLTLTYIINSNNKDWTAGYFTQLTVNYFPFWLGIWMIISSAVSNFGALASGMSQLSWTMWAMGKGRKDKIAKHRYLPYFVSWSWTREDSGGISKQPLMALILVSLCDIGLSAVPYNYLSQFYLVIRSANVLCEYACFIKLRFIDPHRDRPFKAPGGAIGTIIWTLPSVTIIIFCMVNMVLIDYHALLYGLAACVAISFGYPLKQFWKYITHKVYEILSRTVH